MSNNTLTIADIKRRGMAVIEERLRRGPVHLIKRNKAAAVVLSEKEYQRLAGGARAMAPGMTAIQWLLAQPAKGQRTKSRIDAELRTERDW